MNNIKKARMAAGLSQKYVAATLGVAGPSVSNWESGKTKPTPENLAALADLFNVTVDYLIGREENALHTVTVSASRSGPILSGRDAQSAVSYPGAKAVGRSVSHSMTHGVASVDLGHGENAVQWYNAAGGESLDDRLRRLSPALQKQALDYIKFLEMQEEEE